MATMEQIKELALGIAQRASAIADGKVEGLPLRLAAASLADSADLLSAWVRSSVPERV